MTMYDNPVRAPWWKDIDLSIFAQIESREDFDGRLFKVCEQTLMQNAVFRKNIACQTEYEGRINKGVYAAILSTLEKWEAKIVSEQYSSIGRTWMRTYCWTDGMLTMSRQDGLSIDGKFSDLLETGDIKFQEQTNHYDDDDEAAPLGSIDGGAENDNSFLVLKIISREKGDVKEILEVINRYPAAQIQIIHKNPGYVYVMAATMTGVQILPIGLSGKKLERENYDRQSLVAYDRAIRDFNSDTPRGRLTILEGVPGSGKTHMVKGFMEACSQARFVFIQPSILERLADPGLIPTLINEMNGPGPIIFVLEDADACLSQRKAENMSSIQAMLNLSDGILGSLFDLRILATTNTKVTEFDEAIMRPGRLSEHIMVEKLDLAGAKVVWQKLAGDHVEYPFGNEGTTLAELYSKKFDLTTEQNIQAEHDALRKDRGVN